MVTFTLRECAGEGEALEGMAREGSGKPDVCCQEKKVIQEEMAVKKYVQFLSGTIV